MASGAEDVPPVTGGDLTDLLRACLVALRLPPHAEAYQPRRLPFWSVGDAAARIRRLLDELPGGMELAAFLPKIVEADPGRRNLHGRAAVAAIFVAGLELTRDGALTLNQDGLWQPVRFTIPVRQYQTPYVLTAFCLGHRERLRHGKPGRTGHRKRPLV